MSSRVARLAIPVLALVFAALRPAPLFAQSPVITPAGDPSIRNDTIYRLAVDSTKYPDDDYVILLDDGVIRFETDGRGRRTYRQVVQVLRPDAVEQWGEFAWGYDRSSEKLTMNWVRVVRPDGTVISAKPDHQQESDANVDLSAPVYSDARVIRFTLGGVAPGTLVDWSYTVETVNPPLKGDFSTQWYIDTGVPVLRSRLVLDVPEAMKPTVIARNLKFKPTVSVKGGRRVTTWATADVAKRPGESFVAHADSVDQNIEVWAPMSWDSVGHWVGRLIKDRFELSPDVVAEFGRIAAGAKTLDDSLRALHKWVAKDFRYVSLSLGIGGYRPRLPAEVLQTRYGDCKDKTVLFVALARRMGVTAYPVVLSLYGSAEKEHPSVRQFDHMIAAIERNGSTMYLDLTSEITPYGQIPRSEQGGFALIVKDERTTVQVTLPEDGTGSHGTEMRVTGALAGNGELVGRVYLSGGPVEDLALAINSGQLEARDRDGAAQGLATAAYPGAVGDSLQVTIAEGKPTVISARLRVTRAVTGAGNTRVLSVPFGAGSPESVISELQKHVPRRYWINGTALFGDSTAKRNIVELDLPAGWKADLPESRRFESDFASIVSDFRQEGAKLRLSRVARGATNNLRPERLDEVVSWLRKVSEDDVRFVVLHPGQ